MSDVEAFRPLFREWREAVSAFERLALAATAAGDEEWRAAQARCTTAADKVDTYWRVRLESRDRR